MHRLRDRNPMKYRSATIAKCGGGESITAQTGGWSIKASKYTVTKRTRNNIIIKYTIDIRGTLSAVVGGTFVFVIKFDAQE